MNDYFKRVAERTQTRFWINNVTEEDAHKAIDAGASGCTQNPSYSYKMLTHPKHGARALETLRDEIKAGGEDNEVLIRFQRRLVGEIARVFLPMHRESRGELGYVSIQGDPFDESFSTIMKLAHYNREVGENIMVKIPATDDGIKAIEQCVSEGIPVNCTEVMSVQQALDVLDAYDRGAAGLATPPMAYISHIAGIFDEYMRKEAERIGADVSRDSLFLAGKAVAQKVRHYMDIRGTRVRLINGGARGLQHFTEWVGGDVSSTINWLGTADRLLELDGPVVPAFWNPVPLEAVDELVTKMPDFEKAYFPGRLSPEEYEGFGPVELFCSSFRKNWKQALEIIGRERV